jgi:hypothetical protein
MEHDHERRTERTICVANPGCAEVTGDLGEVYEPVYAFIRKGSKLPVYARWIEGSC